MIFGNKLTNLLEICCGDQEYIKVIEEEPLRNECQHFIEVVEKNIHPLTNEIEGLQELKVLTAATQSQVKNKITKILNKIKN